MTTRSASRPTTALLAAAVVLSALAGGSTAVAGDQKTEDVLYMHDGRELHGRIVSETDGLVVLQVVKGTISSTLTFARHDIARIERDVPTGGAPGAPAATATARPATPAKPDSKGEAEARFGRARATGELDVPGLYLVPMKGQLGTDIHPDIYKDVAEDIRGHQPDLVVFVMDCKDADDLMLPPNEQNEEGLFMHHEYREIVNLFRDGLRDIPQVMWVEDSLGFSSLVAMAWERMYMKNTARLGGLRGVAARAEGWSDPDVAAKMMAAWTGIGRSFLENGGYAKELADAMMQPKFSLSASFKGREVQWLLNDTGQYLIDHDDEHTVDFRAKAAEDLLISKGTADSLDDLAFLLGYREYRLVGDSGEKLVDKYRDDWRAAFEKTKQLWVDYEDSLGRAGGDSALAQLGRAAKYLENIIALMNRYEAVEIRWRTDRGQQKAQLEILLEQLQEQIRAIRRGERGAGGGGYGGGGGIGRGGG